MNCIEYYLKEVTGGSGCSLEDVKRTGFGVFILMQSEFTEL